MKNFKFVKLCALCVFVAAAFLSVVANAQAQENKTIYFYNVVAGSCDSIVVDEGTDLARVLYVYDQVSGEYVQQEVVSSSTGFWYQNSELGGNIVQFLYSAKNGVTTETNYFKPALYSSNMTNEAENKDSDELDNYFYLYVVCEDILNPYEISCGQYDSFMVGGYHDETPVYDNEGNLTNDPLFLGYKEDGITPVFNGSRKITRDDSGTSRYGVRSLYENRSSMISIGTDPNDAEGDSFYEGGVLHLNNLTLDGCGNAHNHSTILYLVNGTGYIDNITIQNNVQKQCHDLGGGIAVGCHDNKTKEFQSATLYMNDCTVKDNMFYSTNKSTDPVTGQKVATGGVGLYMFPESKTVMTGTTLITGNFIAQFRGDKGAYPQQIGAGVYARANSDLEMEGVVVIKDNYVITNNSKYPCDLYKDGSFEVVGDGLLDGTSIGIDRWNTSRQDLNGDGIWDDSYIFATGVGMHSNEKEELPFFFADNLEIPNTGYSSMAGALFSNGDSPIDPEEGGEFTVYFVPAGKEGKPNSDPKNWNKVVVDIDDLEGNDGYFDATQPLTITDETGEKEVYPGLETGYIYGGLYNSGKIEYEGQSDVLKNVEFQGMSEGQYGTALHPLDGDVYFVKEIPDYYLTPKTLTLRGLYDEGGKFRSLLVALVRANEKIEKNYDFRSFNRVGYEFGGEGATDAQLATVFTNNVFKKITVRTIKSDRRSWNTNTSTTPQVFASLADRYVATTSEQYQQEETAAAQEIENLHSIQNALIEQLNSLQAEYNQVLAEYNTVSSDLNSVNSQITNLGRTLSDYQSQLNEKNNQIGKLQGQIDTAQNELSNLQSQMEALENQDPRPGDYDKKHAELERKISEKNVQLDGYDATMSTYVADKGVIEAQIADLNSQIGALNSSASGLSQQKATLSARLSTLSTQISTVQTSINNGTRTINSKQEAFKGLVKNHQESLGKLRNQFLENIKDDSMLCYEIPNVDSMLVGKGVVEVYPFLITPDGVKVTATTERSLQYKRASLEADADGKYTNPVVVDTIVASQTEIYNPYDDEDPYVEEDEDEAVGNDEPVSSPIFRGLYEYDDYLFGGDEAAKTVATVNVFDDGLTTQETVSFGSALNLTPAGKANGIFAGWYLEEACVTPADLTNVQSDMSVYARYISDAYLKLGFWKTTSRNVVTKVRLTAAVDKEYAEQGFAISIDNDEVEYVPVAKLNKSVNNYTATDMYGPSVSDDAKMFYYDLAVKGLAKGTKISVTPYFVREDGALVFGTTRVLVYKTSTLE